MTRALRATAPPPARRPPPRAAAVRLPVPGDRGLPRRPGGARRPLPRPVPGLAPAVRGPHAVPLSWPGRWRSTCARGGGSGSTACSSGSLVLFGVVGARPGRPGPRSRRPPGSSRSSTSGSASSACWRPPRCGPSRTTSSRPARRAACSASWGRARPWAPRSAASSRAPWPARFGAESLLVVMAALLLLATAPVRALWRRRPAAAGGPAACRPGRATGSGPACAWCWAPRTCGRSPGSSCCPRS